MLAPAPSTVPLATIATRSVTVTDVAEAIANGTALERAPAVAYSSMNFLTAATDTQRQRGSGQHDHVRQDHFAYGQNIGVMDPTIYAYESLGATLADFSGRFENAYSPLTTIVISPDGGGVAYGVPPLVNTADGDKQFATKAYTEIFDITPSAAVVDHFLAQVNFLKNLYAANNLYGSADHQDLIARGAVYGQMLGFKAEMDVDFVGVPPSVHPGGDFFG